MSALWFDGKVSTKEHPNRGIVIAISTKATRLVMRASRTLTLLQVVEQLHLKVGLTSKVNYGCIGSFFMLLKL